MTDYIPQTSASDRYAAARKALGAAAMYGVPPGMSAQREANMVLDLVEALRALITPPSVGESERDMAMRIASAYYPHARGTAYEAAARGIRAGIQAAHETWEASSAEQPSQEQMLRWLGIEHSEGEFSAEGIPCYFIHAQAIEREED